MHEEREVLAYCLMDDRCGLKYREIARLPGFAGVRMNSLRSMVRHEKNGRS